MSGFASGEGSFTYFSTNIANEIVKDYSFVFEVSQNTKDLDIFMLIGNVYTDIKRVSRYRLITSVSIL